MTVPVKTSVHDGVATILLDRPAALNALDLRMVQRMRAALEAWRDDESVRAVVVRSTSPKAFCSGGDIRAVREAALRGDADAVRGYFAAEYGLDAAVAGYPKPYVSLIDGYALGGGLGISVHGSVRVVTERAGLAMPETAIGFFPDIGAGYFLPRLRGAVGTYLGLTGARVSGAAAVECGLATHYVDSGDLPSLERELTASGGRDLDAVLARYRTTPPPSELHGHYEAIDRCFGVQTLEEVFDRLDDAARSEEDGEWARETLAALRRAAPSSLVLTFEVIRRGASSSLAECLDRDLRLALRVAPTHDFTEGVRAALVDKDRQPRWSPGTPAELTREERDRLVAWLDG
ncbi:enoyl-CoA hydratase/isomerase family protein [Streptomyces sp. ICBB 8177]|uniref:enoyl-CoA hydratase/isomerase family protein n=1 Tax=Streptomyces sp. ICBB 8177 TaxID=563922 RepID=UPI000D67BD7A|nr:enoyl-CoA hydratase/isomerase family protein [Streptomyces sp. ICBB 8177]PWI41925.1 enoyl-CoA hydratase [Streptomyces sp. ICBB 8177]